MKTKVAKYDHEFIGENRETAPLVTGMAVCCTGSKAILLASSANPILFPCVGLVRELTLQQHRPSLVHTGFFTLLDWTLITGSPQLAVRGTYFLSTSPGRLTLDPNESGAKVCQLIGKSVCAATLQLLLWDTILL